MWVINPAAGCHYFLPGLQLPPQPLSGLLPVLLLGEQRHNGVNSLPKTVTRQRRDCDSNPCPPEPESGTLTTRLPIEPPDDYDGLRYKSKGKFFQCETSLQWKLPSSVANCMPMLHAAVFSERTLSQPTLDWHSGPHNTTNSAASTVCLVITKIHIVLISIKVYRPIYRYNCSAIKHPLLTARLGTCRGLHREPKCLHFCSTVISTNAGQFLQYLAHVRISPTRLYMLLPLYLGENVNCTTVLIT